MMQTLSTTVCVSPVARPYSARGAKSVRARPCSRPIVRAVTGSSREGSVPATTARRPLLLSSAAAAAAAALLPLATSAAPAVAADREPLDLDELTEANGWVETDTGLIYKVTKEGSGEPCFKFVPNPFVKVNFEGFTLSGRKFVSTYDERRPFGFQVGIVQRVTPGFDEAVYSMRVGERRQVYVPPELGFGRKGMPPGVAQNAPLFYDIDLLSLQPY